MMPGGSSTPFLTNEHLDVALDFDSLAAAGSMLGSGAVIVIDDATCMVGTALRLTKFYRHESCGKCTPCREGLGWLVSILEKIESGKGELADMSLLSDVSSEITGKTLCPLGDAGVIPVQSSMKKFSEEYELHIKTGECPFERAGAGSAAG